MLIFINFYFKDGYMGYYNKLFYLYSKKAFKKNIDISKAKRASEACTKDYISNMIFAGFKVISISSENYVMDGGEICIKSIYSLQLAKQSKIYLALWEYKDSQQNI